MDPQSTPRILLLENTSYHIIGGKQPVCREIHLFGQKSYSDLFPWAADPSLSEYMGQQMVAGRSCHLWNLRSNNQTKLNLCADGDVPVQLNITYPKNDGSSFNVSYQFGPLNSHPGLLQVILLVFNSISPTAESFGVSATELAWGTLGQSSRTVPRGLFHVYKGSK